MKRAHITVYLTLIFTLILSVFLSAFEAVRGNCLKVRMDNAVQTAIHSSFAEYHEVLFERYGLLFIDTSYMTNEPDYRKVEERLELYIGYNLLPGEEQSLLFARDWYDIEDYNVSLTNIRLATDDGGNVMRQQAVDYIGNYVGKDWIEEVQSWVAIVEEYEISSEEFEAYHKEVQQEKEACWQENNLLGEEWQTNATLPPLDFTDNYLGDFWGELINYNGTISNKAFHPWEHASHRWNIQGTEVLEAEGTNVTDEILFGEYILHKMGNYRNVRPDSKLDYQVEYILFGTSQDSMNLMTMQETLFFFRGAANLTMLLSDHETQKKIETISQLGVLVDIPPELLRAIINVCWAVAESIDDVKKLMDGEEVYLLKRPKDFSIGLGNLLAGYYFTDTSSGPVSEDALSVKLDYEDYLRIFLYLQPPAVKVFRCMDMMEADIRLTEGNDSFRMDGCADAISLEVGINSGYGYFYSMERKYSYF